MSLPGRSTDDVIAGVGAVVYKYSNKVSVILRGMPPPWSLTRIVTSCEPLMARTENQNKKIINFNFQ